MHAANWAEQHAPGLRASLITPERVPLEVLGDVASAAVERALREAGVALLTDRRAHGLASRHLMLDGVPMEIDAAIATPRLEGVRFSGVPSDYSGFVLTDEYGAVEHLDDVYAVGDLSGFPSSRAVWAPSRLTRWPRRSRRRPACRSASGPPSRTLRVRLAGGSEPLFLTAELDAHGRPRPDTSAAVAGHAPWWPPAKVYARRLAPYLALQQSTPATCAS